MTGSALLILTSPDGNPSDVSDALALTPFQSWRRGERTAFTLPDGTKREFDSTHEWAGWKARLEYSQGYASLQEQVEEWLRQLDSRSAGLAMLQAQGWETELNCFSAGTAELELEPGQLALLGRLSVRLAVFALCPGDRPLE